MALALSLVLPAHAAITITSQASSTSTATTSHTITLPASIQAGELIVACALLDATGSWSWTGYTELFDVSGNGGAFSCAYKFAAGGETSASATSSVSNEASYVAFRCQGCHASTPPESGTAASGQSNAPDPPSLNPAGWDVEEAAWIILGTDSASNSWQTDPANYGNCFTASESTGSTAIHACWRILSAASEDPGAFGTSSSTIFWWAQTLALRPAAVGAPGGKGWLCAVIC